MVYHLGAPAEPVPKRCTLGRWSWERDLDGVTDQVPQADDRIPGTAGRAPGPVPSVQGNASEPWRTSAGSSPGTTLGLASLALLDRQQHIEPYLNEVAAAVNHRTGTPIAASTAKSLSGYSGGVEPM